MYIRYKRIGKHLYAYQVEGYWDAQSKITRHKTKYLGKVIDANHKKFEKVLYNRHREKAILDFGEVYLISSIYKQYGLEAVVREALGDVADIAEVLVFNRILHPLPMKSICYWAANTYLSRTHDLDALTSQNISRVLAEIGDEAVLRRFFTAYGKTFRAGRSNLFDITPLPTSMNLASWGYSDSGVDFQAKLALLIDKSSQLPLWFRLLPGNLADVSALIASMQEAEKLGFKPNMLVLDRGFFSKPNIKTLFKMRIRFLMPISANTKVFNRLVGKHQRLTEKQDCAFQLNDRLLFGIKERVDRLYAYIIVDPERRIREFKDLYSKHFAKVILQKRFDTQLKRKGFMILLSTEDLPIKDALSFYYTRNFIEKCFSYFKSDLALLPLRGHNEATIAGYLLINFIAFALYLQLKKTELKISLEEAFQILHGLKKKIYEDGEITTEATKEQKEILKTFNILVPK